MKKLPVLLLCLFIALLAGCARAYPDAGNSAAIWDPMADAPLSSSGQQSGTTSTQVYNKRSQDSLDALGSRISAITQEDRQVYMTAGDENLLFTQEIQFTTVSYPGEAEAECAINAVLQANYQAAVSNAQSLLSMAEEDYAMRQTMPEDEEIFEFYGYSYYAIDSVTRIDSAILSVTTYYSSYTGGAHPDNMQKALCLDTATGEQMSLAQVLLPDGEQQLEGIILDWLASRAGDYGLFEWYTDVVAEKFQSSALDQQTTDWYFSTDGLTVFFNPYEITPYAAGVVKITLPYSSLNGLLEPAYFPQAVSGGSEASISAGFSWNFDLSAAEFETSEVVPSPAGESAPLFFVFETEGSTPVYDLRLYLVNWAGEQPILERSLYAANYLSDVNLVTIEIDQDSIGSDLCVQFAGEGGVPNVLYYDLDAAASGSEASG